MKKKKILEHILRLLARVVLWKYRPKIVGITGSVGKSSTKEAVALVLSAGYAVRKAEGNYNNEIGIPLMIIGAKSGGASFIRWIGVFFKWLCLVVLPSRYPEILVLEMGIDRPGDMEYLLNFVPVHIGIVTGVSSSHMAFFGSVGQIAKEKGRLIAAIPEDGYAILNADDKRVLKMGEKTKVQVITYGFGDNASLRADNIVLHRDMKQSDGFSIKLNFEGKSVPVRLPHIIARHHIPAALAAAAAGRAFRMNLVEIASALERFTPLPGRLCLLNGKDGSFLLDDTYNASPVSTQAALETMKEFIAPRKVVILGDMLELGSNMAAEHEALAQPVVAAGAHIVITVGKHMQSLHETLLEAGLSRKQAYWAPDPLTAATIAQGVVRTEDLVLIKGSQGMRMEKVTERLLGNPEEAERLLCRQYPEWKKQPFTPPAEWVGKEQ